MTSAVDSILIQHGIAHQIWPGTPKRALPEMTPEIMQAVVEAPAGSVAPGQPWDEKRGRFVPPPPPTAEDLLAHLASLRFAAEAAGTSWDGMPVRTDRPAVTALANAAALAGAQERAMWKAPDGTFHALSGEELRRMARAAALHVQAAFRAEAATAQEIVSGCLTSMEAVAADFARRLER